MCEIKTVLIATALFLAAFGFCIYQVISFKKVEHNIRLQSESPCKKEYKKCCMNGGECYYLIDEDIVGCNCTWLYGGIGYERYMCWSYVKLLSQNLTRCKKVDTKSDEMKKS